MKMYLFIDGLRLGCVKLQCFALSTREITGSPALSVIASRFSDSIFGLDARARRIEGFTAVCQKMSKNVKKCRS